MSNQINISEAETKNIEDYLNNQKTEYREAINRLVETNQLSSQDDWGLPLGQINYGFHIRRI